MSQLNMTNEELKNWESCEDDIGDRLHQHFEEFGSWDWCETAEEGRRVYKAMINESAEYESPIDFVISAVAAQADHSVYQAIAAALGVDANALRVTVAMWSENQDNPPPPVSAEKLMAMVEEQRLETKSWMEKRQVENDMASGRSSSSKVQ